MFLITTTNLARLQQILDKSINKVPSNLVACVRLPQIYKCTVVEINSLVVLLFYLSCLLCCEKSSLNEVDKIT